MIAALQQFVNGTDMCQTTGATCRQDKGHVFAVFII
jgi:hypothetical protein